MEILIGALAICLLLSLYNFWMMLKINKSLIWLLQHVHIVGKAAQKDPDFKQIKQTFGIEEDGPEDNN